MSLTDAQLLRYSRHILLNEIGIEGQVQLLASHALVIGAGGLGSPAAIYLGSAGVGTLTVIDHDTVDDTNLQRQIAHTLDRVGMPKAESMRQAVAAINPEVHFNAVVQRADDALLDHWVAAADVVLDCTDNFSTRHAINRACVRHQTPLVSGAAIRMDGQVCVFDSRVPGCPCYACLFPPHADWEDSRCATMGVFAPLVGIIGSVQAAEALKLLSGQHSRLRGRLLMLDGREMSWSEVQLPAQDDCPVCAHVAR